MEVATALQARRAELLADLRRRGDARGLSETILEEIVDDAVGVVVMMRRPISSDEHLTGAFWATVRILLRQHHEGRHAIRVGKRSRVGLEAVAGWITSDELGPDEILALKDRLAHAADFVSQLNRLERDVVTVMAVRGTGIKLTARVLGIPVKTVKAAQRSAQAKLDRVALIATAGRMCDYREQSISAFAYGSEDPDTDRAARAHLAACVPCRAAYVKLVREMRTRSFRRDAATALLPLPAIPSAHSILGRMLDWIAGRPRFGGERAAEALGGAGVVKAAAVGGAVVAATATLAGIHPPILPPSASNPHRAHPALRKAVAHKASVLPATTTTPSPSQLTPPPAAPRVPTSASKPQTSRQHAEREFSPERSASSRASYRVPEAPSASAADVSATPREGTEVEPRRASQAGGTVTSSGPSKAAREFGLP